MTTDLRSILGEARRQKFLGPQPIDDQLANGRGFVRVLAPLLDGTGMGMEPLVVDLGSGGGVPSSVMITELPAARFVLVERGARRAEFLSWMVGALEASERVEVVCAEAEDAARRDGLEASAAVVTARSFAAPSVTAECACRFLSIGASLVVSEPPDGAGDRWDGPALDELGLDLRERTQQSGSTFQRLELTSAPGERYPRRAGVPRKRPLW
jgi:16S rRNA (guanine527-N7)-methyltransferase